MEDPMNKDLSPDFRFNWKELAGAIGGFGTLIPLLLAVSVVADINLGYVLLFFSIWFIIIGIYYKSPVPVEPMKAIGAIVIAGNFKSGEVVASGIVLGVLFLLLGHLKTMKYIQEKVPESVIRGIQLGLALLLVKTSLNFIYKDYILGFACIIIILAFFVANRYRKIPDVSALVVIFVGLFVGFSIYGIPTIKLLTIPQIIIPTFDDFVRGTWTFAIPQAPLTLTNAILATSLLLHDLVRRDINPDRLSKSLGLMNLLSVPFGGFPMCHGAGTLAAQYRFGARTGGVAIISGLILLPVALFFASPQIISTIPLGVFGALLIFSAFELAKTGFKTDSYYITIIIALLSLFNITLAFIIGMVMVILKDKIRNKNKSSKG